MIALALLFAARSLTLDEAIALAEERSVEIDAAKIDVERAQLQTLRANLDRVSASVDASVGELYAQPLAASPGILLGLSALEARIGVPLFSGFRVEAGIARAEHMKRRPARRPSASDAISSSPSRAYWSVRRLVRARVDAGLAAGLDINRAAG